MEKQQNKAQPDAAAYLRATIKFAEWIEPAYKNLVEDNDSTDFVRELYLCACMGIDPEKIAEAKAQPNPPHSMAALRRVAIESEILAGPEMKLTQLADRISGAEDSLEEIRNAIDKLAAGMQNVEERASAVYEEQPADRIAIPVQAGAAQGDAVRGDGAQGEGLADRVTNAALGAVAATVPESSREGRRGAETRRFAEEAQSETVMQDAAPGESREFPRGAREFSQGAREFPQGARVIPRRAETEEFSEPPDTELPKQEEVLSQTADITAPSEPAQEEDNYETAKPVMTGWLERRRIRKERKKMLPFLNQVMEGGYNPEQIEFLLTRLEAGDTPDEAALYASPNLPVEVMERLRGIYTKGDEKHGG